jgi:DNA-binding transcriptional MerR regulator/methylmalonyl-CoA mutase cobalamin-binding subunit
MAKRGARARSSPEPQYRIGAAARLTGLTTHVIRVWERRYAVLAPNRSVGGARLYSESELQRLRLLRSAVDRGHAIGQIAGLAQKVLERLAHPSGVIPGPSGDPSHFTRDFLAAIEDLDVSTAKRVLSRAAVSLSPRALVVDLLGPLLGRVGDRWATGKLCVASEHIASALVRDLLGSLLRESTPEANAEMMIATTPEGELHELGALLTAVTAAMHGLRSEYIGPNLPADQIAQTVRRNGASILAVSIVALDTQLAAQQLRAIASELPAGVSLVAGGAGALQARHELGGALEVVSSLTDFEAWLFDRADDGAKRRGPKRARTSG